MSDLDVRKNPDYATAVGRIPRLKLRPLVGPEDLHEVAAVTDVLPEMTFPINSAGELLDQIGDGKKLPVMGMDVDPVRMIKYMPAYYFPLASYENLVEKMAELVRANRRQVDVPKYVEKIREKMRRARFPIKTKEELERTLGNAPDFNIGGKRMNTRSTISSLPDRYFPIRDLKEFEMKATHFLHSRPLLEKD